MGQIASLSNALRENEIYELDLGKYQNLTDEEISVILEVLAQSNKSVRTLKICNPNAGKLSAIQLAQVVKKCKNLKELQIQDSQNLFLHCKLQVILGSVKRIAVLNCGLDDSALECMIKSNNCKVNYVNLSGNFFSTDAIGRFLSHLSTTKIFNELQTQFLLSVFYPKSLESILNLSMSLDGVHLSYDSDSGILYVKLEKLSDTIVHEKNENEEGNCVSGNNPEERIEEMDDQNKNFDGEDENDDTTEEILWDVVSSLESELTGSEFVLV
jgi:hypothetical protein